jgi:hypothetical protein
MSKAAGTECCGAVESLIVDDTRVLVPTRVIPQDRSGSRFARASTQDAWSYDVDSWPIYGKRFLAAVTARDPNLPPISIVINCHTLVNRAANRVRPRSKLACA